MEHKTHPVREIKAITEGDEAGTVEALVSVFGNVDDFGDRMIKGAFKRTLEERGLPYFVWAHEWNTVPIGVVQSAEETDEGLKLKARLFVGEGEDHPIARQVYTAMKALDGQGKPALREFSFGFQTKSSRMVEEDGAEIREITDVDLFEAGPCLVGVNPETQVLAVKAIKNELQKAVETAEEEDPQPDDKPAPKEKSEEEQARIGRLLAAHPIHTEKE